MDAFWEDVITQYSWGEFLKIRCSNCKQAPLERQEFNVYSPYCPWCGCRMTNVKEE